MNSRIIEWMRRHPMAVYLLLANGITWILWISSMIFANKHGYLLPTMDSFPILLHDGFTDAQHVLVSLGFSLAVYGPLIGALAGTWLDGGRASISKLWGRMNKWRFGLRWYLVCFLIALLLAFLPVGLAMLTGISNRSYSSLVAFIPYVLPLFLWQLITSGFGEEPGWRGFLLPRLKTRSGGEKYIWVSGLIWAIWHYPITAYSTLSLMVDVPPAAMVAVIILALAGNTMSLIGLTYIYAWLVNSTQSVFLAIVFHAATNVATMAAIPLLGGPQLAIVIAIMPWLLVLFMQRILGKERFPGNEMVAALPNERGTL